MREVMYCEKCGQVYHILFRKKCDFCGTKMKILPEEMKQKYNIFNDSWYEVNSKIRRFRNCSIFGTIQEELALREELISRTKDFVMNELADNPVFSMEAYDTRVEKEREENICFANMHYKERCERYAKSLAQQQKERDRETCIPRCPVCGSTNIQKITIATRAVKTAAFGVVGAVDDAGKTNQCQNCGSKF